MITENEYLKAKEAIKEYEIQNKITSVKLVPKSFIKEILDLWSKDHGNAWDYDADKDNVERAITRYEEKLLKINS